MNKWNGCCPDSGYDKFEQQVREEFIEYASRAGLNLETKKEYPWDFECSVTNKVWRAYHVAHVRGRMFDCGEGMINYHKDEVCFWFRVFGYGLTIINRDKQPAPFSVRSGNTKEWRVGKWGVKILWRSK